MREEHPTSVTHPVTSSVGLIARGNSAQPVAAADAGVIASFATGSIMRRKVIAAALSFSLIVLPAYAQDDAWLKYSKAGLEALHQRRLGEAAQNLEAALREMEKANITDSRLADNLLNLALVYQLRRKYIEAEALYVRALAIYESNHDTDAKAALPLWNLGKLYLAVGDSEKALGTLQRALSLAEKAKGPETLMAAGILRTLAEVYIKNQTYDAAEAVYRKALPIYEKYLGREHWTVAETLEGYASLLRKLKRKSEATEAEERAKKIRAGGKKPEPYTIP